MAQYAAFKFSSFVPKKGAGIEELGTEYATRYFEFPFVNGVLAQNAGFRGRKWRARCLLCAESIAQISQQRAAIRALVGVEDILSVCGESFPSVIIPAESILFGNAKATTTGFIQEVEFEFRQLREL